MRPKRIAVFLCVLVCAAGTAVAQTEWTDHPDNPVIGFDDVGPWASGGAWISAVVFDGMTYHLWFTGTDEVGWIVDTGIGHATSPDGIEWTMDPSNPVITAGASGEWDHRFVLADAVVFDGSLFHMWYVGTGEAHGTDKLGYATSPDGSEWTKYENNPVIGEREPGSWEGDALGFTAVIPSNGGYQAWYGATSADGVWSIGYAESDDGIEWNRRPEPVMEPGEYPDSWEQHLLNPSVIFDDTTSTYHMWYAGDKDAEYTKIGYAYSDDGIEWTKHRGNPVHEHPDENLWALDVLSDGTTWHMWYTGLTLPESINQISYATSDNGPGRPALDKWRYIPAAAVAFGAEGAFYQTDVDVSNADDQAVEYEFSWLPRGEDNSEAATSETFSLETGKCVRYTNVLAEVFDLEPDSLGALVIRSTSPDLLAMSRTYNLGIEEAGGTYGQAMPAITQDDFLEQGERRRILFGSENADMRTNIGCQNGDLNTVAVFMELFDSNGTSLARPFVMLRALGNDQVNRIFDGHNPVNGYIEISSPSPNASYYCYGSVLDNVTSDPTTIPPQ